MKKDNNRRLNKTCIDCGVPVVDHATRCHSCAAVIRMSQRCPPAFVICSRCGKQVRKKPSDAAKLKSVTYYCSADCRTAAKTVVCPVCGKQFIADHGDRVKRTPTCSTACRDEYRRRNPPAGQFQPVILNCHYCGKPVEKYVSTIRPSGLVFCDMTCKHAWWRGENHIGYSSVRCVCEVCGTEFTRTKGRVDRYGGKFCSRACFSQSQVLPANSYYGPNWSAQKRKARHRDNYTCQHCGITEQQTNRRLDVHHIIPFRKFGLVNYQEANSLNNLITLCKSCHRSIETATANHLQLQHQAVG